MCEVFAIYEKARFVYNNGIVLAFLHGNVCFCPLRSRDIGEPYHRLYRDNWACLRYCRRNCIRCLHIFEKIIFCNAGAFGRLFFFLKKILYNIINFILTNTLQLGVLALIVLFQPELRRVLEQIGQTKLGNLIAVDSYETTIEDTIKEICLAVESMARQRIGALIVIERKTRNGDVLLTGVDVKSKVSASLLVNIFYPNTPLHDGAVIIRENRIEAAGCLLPLTQNNSLSTELGTRHRAAIGMSENSDALVVVVSEETGKISLANGGTLTRNFNSETLKKALEKLLIVSTENEKQRKFSKFKGRTK